MNEAKTTKREKRENGDGSKICYLPSTNRYCSKFMIGHKENGKPDYKCIYGKTEAEVKRKRKEFKKELLLTDKLAKRPMLASKFFNHWFLDYKYHEISDSAYDRIRCAYENQIKPFIENMQLGQITPKLIETIINTANKKGLSYSSIKKIYEVLKPSLEVAVKEKLISENPFVNARLLTKNKVNKPTKKVTIYTQEDVTKLIRTIDDYYLDVSSLTYIHFPLFTFLINTGLRVAECMALKQCDLIEDKTGELCIRVDESLRRSRKRDEAGNPIGGIKVELKSPKTEAGKRLVPLNANAIKALKQVQELNSLLNINSEFIFATKYNTHTTIGRVQKSFENLLKLAEIKENLGIHSLRHLFGSNLANIPDINIKEVSELLGHTDISFTLRTYIHGNISNKRKAVNALV